ncbi:MAG: hypothetical protein ABUS79_07310 [Pseudomonadota bacterium]
MTATARSMVVRFATALGVAILAANCTSTSLTPGKHDSGSDVPVAPGHDSGSGDARDSGPDRPSSPPDATSDGAPSTGGCTGHAPIAGEVPLIHRPTAAACDATPYASAGTSCTSASDCPFITPLSVNPVCFNGQCSMDRCRTDADCAANEICACSTNIGGYQPPVNLCVPATCHVDADCGANGYCSPGYGRCGTVAGYFCHGSADTCIDGSKDCPCGQYCQYTPTTGGFSCAPPPVCAG